MCLAVVSNCFHSGCFNGGSLFALLLFGITQSLLHLEEEIVDKERAVSKGCGCWEHGCLQGRLCECSARLSLAESSKGEKTYAEQQSADCSKVPMAENVASSRDEAFFIALLVFLAADRLDAGCFIGISCE